ncbi:MAG: TPM domain-containing protein [Eubacteriales bacterium]
MKKKVISVIIASVFLCLCFAVAASADEYKIARLVDSAYLLDDYEAIELLDKLDEISERQMCDVVILTVDSLGGKTSTEYADDFFDYCGYGLGANKDGILLLISMEERDWAISTHGYGITAFTDAGQEYIVDKFLPSLSSGDYFEAFSIFANQCDEFLTQAKTGEPYDSHNLPEGLMPVGYLVIAIVFGVGIACVATSSMKRQLQSVHKQTAASNYIRENSVNITDRREMLINTVVSRTEKRVESDSDSSGSSTHTSSSGETHGGSSGKF